MTWHESHNVLADAVCTFGLGCVNITPETITHFLLEHRKGVSLLQKHIYQLLTGIGTLRRMHLMLLLLTLHRGCRKRHKASIAIIFFYGASECLFVP